MSQSESGHVASRYFETRSDACPGQQSAVPLPVVEEILLNLPAHQVVQVCRLVCHEWKELVDSAAHWRERCQREGFQPCDASRPPEDWRLFYFLSMFRPNLLKNPRADDGLQGWEMVENGGDHWMTERNRKPFPDRTVTNCFVTSCIYDLCFKEQLIDLKKEGYSDAFMDQVQPHIKISDWYSPLSDHGSQYQLSVELLGQEKKPISSFQPYSVYFQQGDDYPWRQMTHIFKNYGPGVRFIRFTHGGMGWESSGIQVTNSSVEICPAAESHFAFIRVAGGATTTHINTLSDIYARVWVYVNNVISKPEESLITSLPSRRSPARNRLGCCRIKSCYRWLRCTKPNLLKNPSAQDGLRGWKIVRSGGDCWVIGENRKPMPDTVTRCFVTSYELCLKQQLIDLNKEGYSDAFMDQVQPHIKISDWYAPCPDCGSEYQICVELLDERKKPIRTFQPEKVEFSFQNGEPWCQVSHVFKNYGPGVRFIRFTHGGKDKQFWAGHYGIRITNSSVEIYPADECFSLTNRNLLKNPRADEGLQGWEIVADGGDRWATEGNRRPFPVPKCFVTSNGLCLKQQLIDLKKEGYSDALMDQEQPHIKISDWYAPLSDCRSEYQICVELLDEKKKPITSFQPEKVFFQQGKIYPWRQMFHILRNYGPGVRFIRFTHGGRDTKFQKGQYGIQVTNSSVEIGPTD